jgi:FkbM family methyltransferase
LLCFFKKLPHVDFTYNGKEYGITGFNYDDDILKRIRKKGIFYEIEILEFIKSENLEGIYVDIGANIGNHTIFFANECKSSKVISFECYEKVFDILKLNCEKNVTSKDIILNNTAITNSATAFVQPSDDKNIGETKITHEQELDGISVQARKLDDYIDDLEDIAFIKIDVEGNELDVLKSSKAVLTKFSPVLLVESMWDNFIKVNDFMLGLGYRLTKRFATDPNLYYYKKEN